MEPEEPKSSGFASWTAWAAPQHAAFLSAADKLSAEALALLRTDVDAAPAWESWKGNNTWRFRRIGEAGSRQRGCWLRTGFRTLLPGVSARNLLWYKISMTDFSKHLDDSFVEWIVEPRPEGFLQIRRLTLTYIGLRVQSFVCVGLSRLGPDLHFH
eukprot:tig00021314_g20109.t1